MVVIRFAFKWLLAGWLAGCNVGASSNASSAVFTGSVSVGMPLVGGTLTVTDSSTPARTFTAPLMADGSYAVDTANGLAPFLFHAQGRAGPKTVEIFAASAASSGKVNISPMTSLVVATAAGQDCALAPCTPAVFTAATLADATAKVQGELIPLLTQFGLAIADMLDSNQDSPARTRKWVFFKHIAVGGYVYFREGPLEFIKDSSTGNWRMSGNPLTRTGVKAGTDASMYVPPAGASAFGSWLPLSADSSAYPDGAILIAVASSSIAPTVNLVYPGGDHGAAKITGAAVAEAVKGVSFLPACPRLAGKPGTCINIAQIDNYVYSAAFSDTAAAIQSQVKQKGSGTKRPGA